MEVLVHRRWAVLASNAGLAIPAEGRTEVGGEGVDRKGPCPDSPCDLETVGIVGREHRPGETVGLSFAMRIASSSPSCGIRTATGPKTSSREDRIQLWASVMSVGS